MPTIDLSARRLRLAGLLAAAALAGCHSGKHALDPAPVSPYVEAVDRPIKALAPDEVAAYLEGEGMGFAMAAELNGYPGPRHVLELADSLGLSAEQRTETRAVFDRMQQQARALGVDLVEQETRLDRLFASGQARPDSVELVVREIGRLRGEIRLAHLSAHVEQRQLLNGEQIARYVDLRGYAAQGDAAGHDPSGHDPSGHHQH